MSALLKAWIEKATTEQVSALAKHAETSPGYLYQLASGRRFPSADIAAKIERAAELMAQSETIPSLLPRDFIASVCSTCPYAMQCRAARQTQNPKTEGDQNDQSN